MDVYTAIRSRRDYVEEFAAACPPREVIERLIEAATWAPSHRRTEPWRFHVLAGQGRAAMGEAVAAWLAESGEAGEGPQQAARVRLLRAPVIIVLSQAGSPDDAVRDLEDYAATSCALQNLLLAAEAEGLAAHTSTGVMVQYAGAKQYLGLEPHDRIVGYVYLGYRAEGVAPKDGTRRAPVVRWDWPEA
jgi:nitroreductase